MITILIPEAVLGTKEPSEKARLAAFDFLVAMGNKMSEGGVVRRDQVEGMEVDEDMQMEGTPVAGFVRKPRVLIHGAVQGSIEEYMTMVAAGLTGVTPHMISASVTAISRLVFEFKGMPRLSLWCTQ